MEILLLILDQFENILLTSMLSTPFFLDLNFILAIFIFYFIIV